MAGMTETARPVLKRSFPPVADANTRVLVLGSLPGEESLARQQYYGKPQNQFWRLISEVTGRDLVPLAYAERLAGLAERHVGLWDVFAAANREGSLDSNIRNHAPNDLRGLFARLPQLRLVAFNGGTAARHGLRQILPGGPETLLLPSSSPALTWPYARKLAAWQGIAAFLTE